MRPKFFLSESLKYTELFNIRNEYKKDYLSVSNSTMSMPIPDSLNNFIKHTVALAVFKME